MGRSSFEKLVVLHMVEQRLLLKAVFHFRVEIALHLTVYRAGRILSATLYPLSLRPILILSSHLGLDFLFLSFRYLF